MKRKLLFVSMLSLLLVLLLPASAMAAPPQEQGVQQFEAVASTFISNAGEVTITGQAGPNIFETTVGEQLYAQIFNCAEWPELTGAEFLMYVETNDAILNMTTMTLSGRTEGTINLVKYDDSGVPIGAMSGTFTARVRGNFYVDDEGNYVFYQVTDDARFELDNGIGVFEGQSAQGSASVELTPVQIQGQWTLGGDMTMKGILR